MSKFAFTNGLEKQNLVKKGQEITYIWFLLYVKSEK